MDPSVILNLLELQEDDWDIMEGPLTVDAIEGRNEPRPDSNAPMCPCEGCTRARAVYGLAIN